MGRTIKIASTDAANDFNVRSCCIIARAKAPDGFGPKPVPFPLTTMSSTYNSYGTNYAVPLPYHKHGYQATGDVDVMAGSINYAASNVDQYLYWANGKFTYCTLNPALVKHAVKREMKVL